MAAIISFAAARARAVRDDQDRGVAIAAFLTDLAVAERSDRTIEGHRNELRRYAAWLDDQAIDWLRVSPADLAEYARTRADRGPSSRSSLVITLRVFYRWVVDQEIGLLRSPADKLHTPKRPKAAPRALSSEQIVTLLAYIDDQAITTSTPAAWRDRALVITALYTGFRAAELAALRWSALDLAGLTATVMEGKGARGRTVKLHSDLVAVLARWREKQRNTPDAPVFALSGDRVLAADRVGKIVHTIAVATGLPLTAHVLRHSFATAALRRSHHLYSVSRALGHRQIQTTMVYLRRDASDTDAAVDSLPNRGEW